MDAVDLDRDGQLDAYELQRAIENERRNHWQRANELLSTHPPTFKRILMLEELEEEMKRGGLPANLYKFV
jgi:Zn-dependent protease with chaperone function